MPDITLEDVSQSVHTLSEAVTQMRDGMIDRETVESIAAATLEQSDQHAQQQQARTGYTPTDIAARDEPALLRGTPSERGERLHQRNPEQVASLIGRPACDVQAFQERADELLIMSAVLGSPGQPADPRTTRFWASEYLPAYGAVDTQTGGEGQEYVPRHLSATTIQRVNLMLKVMALFPSIDMPTQPFDIPGLSLVRQRGGIHAEQTADTGQAKFKALTPGTRKITLDAKKFAGRVMVSREAEEDSIIAVLPWIMSELTDWLAADQEDAGLNGDLTATHMDSDTTATDDPRKFWAGLRAGAPSGAKTDGSNGDLSVAMLRANRGKMGKYGVDPKKLAHIVGIKNYIQLLSDSAVLTLDKYGDKTPILTGELARVDGAPLIVSEYIRQDLNASGVYDDTTTNRSAAVTVHTSGYLTGSRRGVTLETLRELYAESDQDAVIASLRKAFTARFPSEPTVAVTFNTQAA